MLKFKNAKNDFERHSKTEYYLLSTLRIDDFLINVESEREKNIYVLLNEHKQLTTEIKKKRLIPIKTILFCARNNLPLRGHRKTRSLSLNI